MRSKNLALFALSSALLLSSCAAMRNVSDTGTSAAPLEATPLKAAPLKAAPLNLIARDFVGALSQLEVVSPTRTTVDLQKSDRNDAFTQAMLGALQRAGYGVRWVMNEGSVALFQYRQVEESAAASARRDTYELAVGNIEMRRAYVTDNTLRVRPVTPLYIRGTDASGIILNDGIFDESDSESSESLQVASVNTVPLPSQAQGQSNTPPTLGLQNPAMLKVPAGASPLDPAVGKAAAGADLSQPLLPLAREQNMFDLGASNFQQALAGSSMVAEQVLTFANDSMRLGSANKRLVGKLVEQFNPETDVFSVIGCSMGPTKVKGGNAALALGRAGRVVEALRFAGVDDSRILDEGCWAGDGGLDSLPARGVVLSLNRQG